MNTELTTPIKIEIPSIGTIESADLYLKSEADKVFAELEERHKMEVEQLLIEIVELKAQKAQAEDDCAYWKMREGNAVNAMHETEEACMFLTKSERHQKYKRCLAKAMWCDEVMMSCELRGYTVHRIWYHRHQWAMRWKYKWLEIAEQFKEAK